MGLINWGKQLQFTQKGAITQQTGCDWWKTLEQHFPDTMVLTVDQDVTVDLGLGGQITLKGGQALMAWDLNIPSLTIIPTQSTNYSCVAFAAVDPLDKVLQRVRIPRIQIAGAKTPALTSAFQVLVADLSAVNPYDNLVTIAGGNNDVDVNANLTKNATKGFIEADEDNTGVSTLLISSDGVSFSTGYANLRKGKSYSIEGLSVDTIRITGTTNDKVRVSVA